MLKRPQENPLQELFLKVFDDMAMEIIINQNLDKTFILVDYLENFRDRILNNFNEIQLIKFGGLSNGILEFKT